MGCKAVAIREYSRSTARCAIAGFFVASSTEGLVYAEACAIVLRELGHACQIWADPNAFQPGWTIIENLERTVDQHDSALVVVTPDTRVDSRGEHFASPRDNILFELGYYTARYGRDRVLVLRVHHLRGERRERSDEARLPSNIKGVVYLEVNVLLDEQRGFDYNAFKAQVTDRLREHQSHLPRPLPVLARDLVQRLESLQTHPNWGEHFKSVASDLLTQLADSMGRHLDGRPWGGIDRDFVNTIARLALGTSDGIYAIDVLGPAGWLNPIAFHYLSVQIRAYIRRNIREDQWRITVSSPLYDAMNRAICAAGPGGSATNFDPGEIPWGTGGPDRAVDLEFCRVLLWSSEELTSQVGRTVVEIHRAFNVPLFWIEIPHGAPERDVDYIVFSRSPQKVLCGFYGVRDEGYETRPLPDSGVPMKLGQPAIAHFWGLLQREDLVFAADRLATVDRARSQ